MVQTLTFFRLSLRRGGLQAYRMITYSTVIDCNRILLYAGIPIEHNKARAGALSDSYQPSNNINDHY